MAGMRGDQLSGLPDAVRALLAAPPLTEKKLMEVGVAWASAAPRLARMAGVLRLFVMTWDPLELLAPRPGAIATVHADPSGLELVVYVPCWSLAGLAAEKGATVAGVLGARDPCCANEPDADAALGWLGRVALAVQIVRVNRVVDHEQIAGDSGSRGVDDCHPGAVAAEDVAAPSWPWMQMPTSNPGGASGSFVQALAAICLAGRRSTSPNPRSVIGLVMTRFSR